MIHLLDKNSSKKNTILLARYLYSHPEIVQEVMNKIKSESHPINFRAAWALEVFFINHKKFYSAWANEWAALLENASESCQRHILKVIAQCKAEYTHEGKLVNDCFNLLLNPKTPVAVKAHALYFLRKKVKTYPELAREFELTLDQLSEMHTESPAIQAVIRRCAVAGKHSSSSGL
jgi:predicted nucleotidyltransferase